MPTVTGTSIKGYQRLLTVQALTVLRFDLGFTNLIDNDVERVGFGYVIGRQNAGTFNRFVVDQQIVHRPGRVFVWGPITNSPSWLYRVDVEWNLAGLLWSLTWA